ncbi:MAG: amidohydrolase [Bacteroidota bacterium]
MIRIFTLLALLMPYVLISQSSKVKKASKLAEDVESKVIEWRHDFHQNPELSNREFETAKKIETHLKELGLKVQTKVAHTGVVGILETGKPGPVVGLRADIDALPVTERVELPYASKVKSEYNNVETGVMHACGHDTHIAIMMGVAEVLTKMKSDLKGTYKFIFQPAEEGAPRGEEGGAELMVKEGVLKNPDVDVIFGLHISAQTTIGQINYRPEGIMAAADQFYITVKGKQTHGSRPWGGVDPVVASAQIINSLQTIVSRQTDLTKEAAVISVGMIQGGVRNNIIPEEVKMIGTIRTLDVQMQDLIHEKMKHMVPLVAESFGAEAEIDINKGVPVTYNDPELTEWAVPVLKNTIGSSNLNEIKAITGAEDFAFFANEIPGFYYFIGGCPKDVNPAEAAPHHTPDFYVDDAGMKTGLMSMINLAIEYSETKSQIH